MASSLLISEFLANPSGNDLSFEYVELIATQTIDFSVTPYSVIFANNGTATSAGWIAGGSITYGFSITSGIVNAGDVVYVGGSSLTPTGTKLRTINVTTTPGDRFGSPQIIAGVLGNGGANADGIAVFNVGIDSITNSTVPIDAIFFGTSAGTAVVSGGTAGYQLPVNDIYNGGKLQANSFLAPDPVGGQVIIATGTYNATTGLFTTNRTWANSATATATSAITIASSALPTVSIAAQDANAAESAQDPGTFRITRTGDTTNSLSVNYTVGGTSTNGTDYTPTLTGTATIAAGQSFVDITITPVDDALIEGNETVTLTLNTSANYTLGTASDTVTIADNDVPVNPTVNLSVSANAGTEAGTTVITVTATASSAVSGDQTVSLAVTGTGITTGDYNLTNSTITILNGQTTGTVTFTVVDDALVEGSETAVLTISNPSAGITLGSTTSQNIVITDNDVAITKIHEIQGSGATAALTGTRTIEAIVVATFSGLTGFYVQEEDADADGNAATSEGIFVFDSTGLFTVSVGDKVRITGTAGEFTSSSANIAGTGNSSLTQISNLTNVTILSSGNLLPNVTNVTLPVTDASELERYEGMRVNISAGSSPLVVTETFKLGRFGQVGLSVGDRLGQYTQFNAPSVSGYANYLANLQDGYIILDDGSTTQNPDPTIHARGGQPLSATNTLRGGDTISSITGVLDERFEGYRVQTTTPANFQATNAREATPPTVGGTLRVASFNLLNFFNGNGAGGGFPTSRGADTATELQRQLDKTVQAILGLNADVFGYNEMENDGFGSTSAVQTLVNALNAATAPGTYAFVTPPAGALIGGNFGGDEITVGFIYKTGAVRVAPGTSVAALTTGIFAQDAANRVQRPALAATFEQLSSGETFTAVINHFKSKGSAANLPGDADQGDGQGFSNATRTQAAQELATWLGTNPTGTADADYLILGDLNAYRLEDPITTLTNAGYTSLFAPASYSFQFNGQWGSLDHALASGSLNSQVTGAAKWHINADEPIVLDYNTEFKSAGQVSSLYNADPFRSSDHDPIVVGLNLDSATASLSGVVYVDANNDGTIDANESRLAGVTITLTGTAQGNAVNRTTTTATDGTYRFNNLFGGTYTLSETQLTGYNDGIDSVGTLGGNTLVNDTFGSITVNAGATGTGYNFGNTAIPLPAPVINPVTSQTAGAGGSTLTGTVGTNFLVGKEGNDTIAGLGGRDRLTGGAGADLFRYEAFTDSLFTNVSTNNQLDHITDFNQADGDRIQINAFTPANLFNAGVITAANLQAAITSVYNDSDPVAVGSQALAINEAVFFTFGVRTYLTVNDGTAGFSNSNDLVIDITNIKFKTGNNIVGSLTVSDYFS